MSKKFRIGIIHRSNLAVINDREQKWEIASFNFASEVLSFCGIFDSAFATPSRYVQEILLRLFDLEMGIEPCEKFVFNPTFEATSLGISQVLNAVEQLPSAQSISILTDMDGLVVGYLFASGIKRSDAHFLTLLSAIDGEIDAEFCRRLYSSNVDCHIVDRLSLKRAQHNGFAYEENKDIYRWTAERAIDALSQVAGDHREAASHFAENIKFTAIMPHHAGDALFFALAWHGTKTRINSLAINGLYSEIVSEVAPELTLEPIGLPPANRGEDIQQGKVMRDSDYFHTIKDTLPRNGFYYYCRPSRDYNRTKLHLIDHFAFALGRQSYATNSLLSHRHLPTKPKVSAGASPLRVLLHFDAGWPLKVYPHDAQESLIDLLANMGYQITVLAAKSRAHPKCHVTTFKNYEFFKELVKGHHMLVGMDSFPVHYAAHILDLPAICLFSSTRPENSNAPSASNYVYLEKGLLCRPCHGVARCPLYGVQNCRNFATPETVAEEVVRLLNCEQENGSPPAMVFSSDEYCKLDLQKPKGKVLAISLNHVKLRVFIFSNILPLLNYFSLLHTEYMASVNSDGFLQANVRTLRFLRRTLHRFGAHGN